MFDRFNFSRLLAENINLRSFDDALLPIEGTDTCDKLCIAIKQIFDNAIDEGVLENNPFTRLSKRFKKPITKNFPFNIRLRNYHGYLLNLIYLMQR